MYMKLISWTNFLAFLLTDALKVLLSFKKTSEG